MQFYKGYRYHSGLLDHLKHKKPGIADEEAVQIIAILLHHFSKLSTLPKIRMKFEIHDPLSCIFFFTNLQVIHGE